MERKWKIHQGKQGLLQAGLGSWAPRRALLSALQCKWPSSCPGPS